MKSFLDIVVEDLLKKGNGHLEHMTVVFPNKRASLFFNKSLQEQISGALWSPKYTTISDLLRTLTPLTLGDRIRLVLELHKVYVEVTGLQETLDQFYAWGELMLADFDDIDKHLADARQVLRLVTDYHELDNTDYLTEGQKEVLKRFFSNFTDGHSSELKSRFLRLWSKFYDIYSCYRERLQEMGLAYEGMIYRDAAERLKSGEATQLLGATNEVYVFVGFNLLNEAEEALFDYLKSEDRARFYWDYDDYYMHGSEAGTFIVQHLKSYPNELPSDHEVYSRFGKDGDMTFLSAPTDDVQARYIAQWLTPERIAAGRKTAIVLADESLLNTVLYCLPPEVMHVNITTGYPLDKTHIASFIRLYVALLQKRALTLHAVNSVLRHPYARLLSQKAAELMERLNGEIIYYPTQEDVAVDDTLAKFFAPLQDVTDSHEIGQRLMWVVKTIAQTGEVNEGETEALYRMYGLLNRLDNLFEQGTHDAIQCQTYLKLLQQIVHLTTVPFHGEPIEGIQIMGILETRNLDFDHLLLLSCNEGNIPAQVNDSSFIPHAVRKAYGLTTIDNKVAIYAYHFHRLIQRAKDVTVTYNSSTENGRQGEMSRFMLQLMAESGMPIRRGVMVAAQETDATPLTRVDKTPEMVHALIEKGTMSPSAMGRYLRCPVSFYYTYIRGIRDDDTTDEEEMNSQAFGNIFHKAAELVYAPLSGKSVTQQYLNGLLKEKGHISLQRIVDRAFREELFKLKDDKRRMPRLGGLQVINREMVLKFLKDLLAYDLKCTPFKMVSAEHWCEEDIEVSTIEGLRRMKVGGIIDRLDEITENGQRPQRVIDYKTGRYSRLSMPSVEDIFDPKNVAKHSAYYLQAILYSCIISKKNDATDSLRVLPALLYVNQLFRDDYSPLLPIDRNAITDIAPIRSEFMDRIRQLIEEILNPEVPFTPTEDKKRCTDCPYFTLCKLNENK